MYPIIVLGQGKNNTVIQKILTFIKQREKEEYIEESIVEESIVEEKKIYVIYKWFIIM
jgi:hypothetical protein